MSFGNRTTVRRYPDEFLRKGLGIKEQLSFGKDTSDEQDVEPDLDEIYKKQPKTVFLERNPLSRKNTARVGGKNRKRRQTKRLKKRHTQRRKTPINNLRFIICF